ncbi:MAG TPA: hypothetical protein VEY12_11100 [Thermoplasmata archaeon]|nr:hypothetical protein [Thermoplasmata archaeon]
MKEIKEVKTPSSRQSQRELSRQFLKERLNRGTSQGVARDAHNALVKLSPRQIEDRWGYKWRGLSGAKPLTAEETHRIEKSRSRHQRESGRAAREEFRARTSADKKLAERLNLPEPEVDYQEAHDAGVLYRATEDEIQRQFFEEGSPR